MTIVLAGGSGFLGRKLSKRLQGEGHRTITLSRRPSGADQIEWRPDGTAGDLPRTLDGVDAVVNLAGEGIADKRWTAARKRALREWEEEALKAESPATRVVPVRSGVALEGDGGALKKMLLPFKLGLGATIGSGHQYFPWVHAADWTAMVSWLIQNDQARGAFNVTSPEPVTNREITRTLGRVLHRPAIFHAPAFVLRAALGELATTLVDGQRVLPALAEQL